jgi:sarcosine oxidase/L-pipecolate oxidase
MILQVISLEMEARILDNAREFHSAYPESMRSSSSSSTSSVSSRRPHLSPFVKRAGYVNPTSGWGEATRACEIVMSDIVSRGCKVMPGKEVVGMTFKEHESDKQGKRIVNGVKFADGGELQGDLIVVATGAWTPALFAQPMMGGLPSVVAAGQCVAKIQLTPEEVREYADMPVVSRQSTISRTIPTTSSGRS